MKENWKAAALGALLAGCRLTAQTPDGFQGVVEYEDRLVAFEVAGRVAKLVVQRGDEVTAGATLAELDTSIEKLNRDVRAAEVEMARADRALLRAGTRREDIAAAEASAQASAAAEDLAKKSAERARTLFADQAITRADLDRANADFDRIGNERRSLDQRLASARAGARPQELARVEARLAEATAALALQDERLQRCTLRAPINGTVLDTHLRSGELAAIGTPIVTLADTARPYIDVFVPEKEIARVAVNAKAALTADGAPGSFDAVVEHIGERSEFTPRFLFSERERPNLVFRVRLRVSDPQRRLRAGLPAFVKIDKIEAKK
jgi:HlyD family secretion protein